ncbi:hypothetical protein [Natronosalvus vescus]|uniref:hypothetical protein n=1 Tax=Natronosalvus vescus TaxID=2953881 RepID=UPI002090EC75|nr:hypothetical protein [Natronosalvus vescus]
MTPSSENTTGVQSPIDSWTPALTDVRIGAQPMTVDFQLPPPTRLLYGRVVRLRWPPSPPESLERAVLSIVAEPSGVDVHALIPGRGVAVNPNPQDFTRRNTLERI